MATDWQKQAKDNPLFPDLLWSRPENKRARGKLLIIGGNLHGFAAVAQAHQAATGAGAGTIRVVLPDATQKLLKGTKGLELQTEFLPSTKSGSFARSALGELLEQAGWADGILFAGDMGRNSETAVLLESFLAKYSGSVTLVQDAADYVTNTPQMLPTKRPVLLVLTIAQLQKLLLTTKQTYSVNMGTDFVRLVEIVRDVSSSANVHLVVRYHQQILVAVNGNVSSTATKLSQEDFWRIPTAASASVWWLQNPAKPYESLCSALAEV